MMNDLEKQYLNILDQRRQYLDKRVGIKLSMDPVPWHVEYDQNERDATAWAIDIIRAAYESAYLNRRSEEE
jgi:hypothetical protein